ncbi:MAG TPA: hypothetical protein VKY73_23045 [Polyangiaceae bacterium]|nr:hypothetical protein [Polyangiaceae bacterium]
MFEDAFEGYEFDEEMGDEEWAGQPEEIDDEVAEYLARELLEVGDEEELEEFLGSLLSSAAKAAGGFLRSNVGKKLVGAAKGLAKQTLPQVGAAVGGHFGGDTGRKLGQKLGGAAAARLELELEEDELEAAKRVVKTACAAAQKAVKTQGKAPPAVVAKDAMVTALRENAPASAAGTSSTIHAGGTKASGTWRRRGRRIVLFGV